MNSNLTWFQYQVFDNESLQSIAIKFDVSVESIKRKNKIRDSSELWNGRTILVPNPATPKNGHATQETENAQKVEEDDDEKDPEHIGFIKMDAFRLRMSNDKVVTLSKANMEDELCGVLLITPSAVMFDPTDPQGPDDGVIIPMGDVKRAALYHINNNKSQAWLQVSGSGHVAYFGIESSETSPLLRCLQKWSPARNVATPTLTKLNSSEDSNEADFAICGNSNDMDRNEEFFSSVETEWQIESGSFEQWTKVGASDMEPKPLSDLPELSHESAILIDGQIICLNTLLPPRFIGARWTLKYSTRRHGTSLKTLYRQVHDSDSPNLCIVKTCCGSIIGCLSSHPLRKSDHFFGSGETFLFRFPHSTSSDNFRQFSWSGSNSFFVRCDKEQLIFGASDGSYAIWIEGSLLRGTSKPTKTFNNPTLTAQKDFRIEAVEVWAFSE